jgi:hypothetical protein
MRLPPLKVGQAPPLTWPAPLSYPRRLPAWAQPRCARQSTWWGRERAGAGRGGPAAGGFVGYPPFRALDRESGGQKRTPGDVTRSRAWNWSGEESGLGTHVTGRLTPLVSIYNTVCKERANLGHPEVKTVSRTLLQSFAPVPEGNSYVRVNKVWKKIQRRLMEFCRNVSQSPFLIFHPLTSENSHSKAHFPLSIGGCGRSGVMGRKGCDRGGYGLWTQFLDSWSQMVRIRSNCFLCPLSDLLLLFYVLRIHFASCSLLSSQSTPSSLAFSLWLWTCCMLPLSQWVRSRRETDRPNQWVTMQQAI